MKVQIEVQENGEAVALLVLFKPPLISHDLTLVIARETMRLLELHPECNIAQVTIERE
jgi:hypothetical protein